MLLHVLDRVAELDAQRAVVVVGHGAERVTKKLVEDGPPGLPIDFVEQTVQRGTGDAAGVALTAFEDDDEDADVLVLAGDMPLVRAHTLQQLLDLHRQTMVPVAKGPQGNAFTADSRTALVSSQDVGLLTRIDLASARAVGSAEGGTGIEVLAFY